MCVVLKKTVIKNYQNVTIFSSFSKTVAGGKKNYIQEYYSPLFVKDNIKNNVLIITIHYCGQIISACYSEEKMFHIKTAISLPWLFCFANVAVGKNYINNINQ